MCVKTKVKNLLLSDKSKQYPKKGSLTDEITTTAVVKKINMDLNEMILYTDEVDEFLNYIDEHNLSLFFCPMKISSPCFTLCYQVQDHHCLKNSDNTLN
jgi:hypothetical protein